ncbi:glucokinase [Prochlorococcus marinus str. MU1404]|uniref:glucokinase n=1 Tax=Prochlorococcus marinus TaxID=1219 RepID=UPI001ADD3E3E|nr:glucokinase [Prochlorococcus marinus]MBO8229799.1 glucokinase [Prochlorococcus marinus XMU1404]MBW3072877.1 glucokinase [Prochlorococcus marinus str. MU1404]MCR8545865.1 glucokinase [Prochlorococcus marinus CUG1432]
MNFLACDLGGTKVLLGIFRKDINDDSPKLVFKKKYLSSEWDSFESILENFLKNECKNITHPSSACFAVAGPLSNNKAKIMNLSWDISEKALQNKFNFQSCELINDFAVQIYGIPFLKKNQYSTIQNGTNSKVANNDLHAIVGAGTGLGIARGIILGSDIKVLASEGGHVEYSPKSKLEWELKNWLKNYLKVERISCERIVSGTGLSRIAEWRLSKPDAQNHPLQKYLKEIKISDNARKELPEKICDLSNGGDQLMIEVERIWLDAYASLLGDVALQELCFGGLWISGGTAPKHFKNFKSDLFMKQFFDKGRLKDILKTIPLRVILDEEFGLFSAACRAKMLLRTK